MSGRPRRALPEPPPPETFQAFMRELQRNDFLAFFEGAFTVLHPGQTLQLGLPHEAIAHVLSQIQDRVTFRQIVNMPPRSLKSEMISVAWVAYCMARHPGTKFMCLSYSEALAKEFSYATARIMRSAWFKALFPECKLTTANAEWIVTSQKSSRYAAPIGGQITGFGAHAIILDDPMKAQDAASEVQRKALLDIYRGTLASRLDDKEKGAVLLVMQRLHPDDLSAELERRGWPCLKLAAIAQEDMRIPLGVDRTRLLRAGQALHPERDSLAVLDRLRAEVGSEVFAAQYLQAPMVAEGALLKAAWFATSPADLKLGPGDYIVQSWDCASKTGVLNDYSVCITALWRRGEVHVLHVMRERLEFPDLEKKAITLAQEHRAKLLLIEDAASGQQLIQSLKRKLAEGRLKGVPQPIATKPTQDKATRMAGVTPLMEAGKLFLPAEAPWLVAFKNELLGFPYGLHDDQADAFSQLLARLRENPPLPRLRSAAEDAALEDYDPRKLDRQDPYYDPDGWRLSRDFPREGNAWGHG